MVKRQFMAGCCAGMIHYDLGGEHGVPNASSQEEFDKFFEGNYTAVNVAVTNDEQHRAVGYLKKQGWIPHEVAHLTVWTISGTELSEYLVNSKKDHLARRLQELEKKTPVDVNADDIRAIISPFHIMLSNHAWLGELATLGITESVQKIYGVDISKYFATQRSGRQTLISATGIAAAIRVRKRSKKND